MLDFSMNLLPIHPTLEANEAFANDPNVQENLPLSVGYYEKIGYNPPWICYYVEKEAKVVGACAFKGKPDNGRVEIAYETFPPFQNQGIGSRVCSMLTELALKTDPTVKVTARTLREDNYSTRILSKNGFLKTSDEVDEDGTEVWEWEYQMSGGQHRIGRLIA